jgi:predicted anti-sigma-YlaC factor YlaD
MNCLEARKELPRYWRRAMPEAARTDLVEHLRDCPQCDRAFRTFALSAPVIHSAMGADVLESGPRIPLNLIRARPLTISRTKPQQTWRTAALAAVLLVAAGLTAWSTAQPPAQNFVESVVGEGSEVDPAYSFDPLENAAAGFFPGSSQFDSPSLDSSELPDTDNSFEG